jgi:hypothetical protein
VMKRAGFNRIEEGGEFTARTRSPARFQRGEEDSDRWGPPVGAGKRKEKKKMRTGSGR